MYNKKIIDNLVDFIKSQDGIADKSLLSSLVCEKYNLAKKRSVFYNEYFAIRFCTSEKTNFSNTVLALSTLRKYDNIPFIVCVVTSECNYLLLANSTFLIKISHSSQKLRADNIKGSFNGSDILRDFEGITNEPENFEFLYTSHQNYSFHDNLLRLVKATNNIHPTGKKYVPTSEQEICIMRSVDRAVEFMQSREYKVLNGELQSRVSAVSNEITIAARIDNVNIRGRVIEYLITTSESDGLRKKLIEALRSDKPLPEIYTADSLGDYERDLNNYKIAIDIKSKVLFYSSNPKGYNIDKVLSFLSTDNSVYLIFVVAIEDGKISTKLCSMYNRQLLNSTRIIKHWAGRNSRGVTQYDGAALENIVLKFDNTIDNKKATEFILECLKS